MTDIKPSFDIDESEFTKLADVAEAVEGTVAVTSEGRLIVYGVSGDINEIVERVNKTGSGFEVTVEALDHSTLGFIY